MKKLLPLLFVAFLSKAQSPEQKLEAMGHKIPAISSPIAAYVHAVRVGNLLYLSGKGPKDDTGAYIVGKLGKDLSIAEGKKAAERAALEHIAVLKAELGSLSRVKRVVKVLGMVNCTDAFTEQPQVINGYSELMVAIFGEKGRHARSAVGHNSLPLGMAVEVEAIIEIE
jgi:enamine deaminase RidA (YjgF/YER057c/UK114 family)